MQATLPGLPSTRRHALLAFVAIAAAVYAVEATVVRGAQVAAHPQLFAGAVAFDLTIGVPFLYWLLVVRPGHARASNLLGVFLASLLGARLVLSGPQDRLFGYEWILVAPLELGIVAYVIVKVRRAARGLRGAPATLDVPERIAAALNDAFPNPIVGRLLAAEVTLGWYALASWGREPHAPSAVKAFSYHRKTGLAALLWAGIAASVIELFVVHLVVQAYSARAAWTLSAVSVVGIVCLIGFVRALVLRPVLVFPDRLVVRGGILWTAEIPREAIEAVESGWALRAPRGGTPGYLGITPVVQANVLLRLRADVEARGLYGRRRTVRVISLSVDEPAALAELLRGGMRGGEQ
jgi:hypothetical protein